MRLPAVPVTIYQLKTKTWSSWFPPRLSSISNLTETPSWNALITDVHQAPPSGTLIFWKSPFSFCLYLYMGRLCIFLWPCKKCLMCSQPSLWCCGCVIKLDLLYSSHYCTGFSLQKVAAVQAHIYSSRTINYPSFWKCSDFKPDIMG